MNTTTFKTSKYGRINTRHLINAIKRGEVVAKIRGEFDGMIDGMSYTKDALWQPARIASSYQDHKSGYANFTEWDISIGRPRFDSENPTTIKFYSSCMTADMKLRGQN